ncbi:MAG TPA: type II CAAX endopeptidase family protein [Caulobacteraceae bacterium]|jgi:membrane protease YdiL (CAAX protease family)
MNAQSDPSWRAQPGAAEPYLEFAARGRNAWWRYVAALVLALALSIVIGGVIGVALSMLGVPFAALAAELTTPTHPPVFMLAMAFNFVVILAGFFLAVWLVQRKSPADLIGQWSWRWLAIGAVLWLGMGLVMTAADVTVAPSGFRWSATPQTSILAGSAVFALAAQTFAEEVLFRGYLTQAMLLVTRRAVPAAVIAGLIFGAAHIPNGLPQAVSAAGFGIAASLIAIRLKGIAFTFGLHWVNNLYGAVVVVASNDLFHGFPGLVSQSTPHLVWFDVATNLLALGIVCAIVLRFSPPPSSPAVVTQAAA